MKVLQIAWAEALPLVFAAAWIGYFFGVRKDRQAERRACEASASTELAQPLRNFQRLLRRFGRDDVEGAEVVAAFIDWAAVWDRHAYCLPAGWGHLARSVRDAAGTVFGVGALAHVRPGPGNPELSEPDSVWQDFADDYLEYLARALLMWGAARRDAAGPPKSYGAWLDFTGRT